MKQVLAIDIGNTNITFGVFRGDRLVKKWKIQSQFSSLRGSRNSRCAAEAIYQRKVDRLLRPFRPRNDSVIVISSVVPGALKKLKKTLKHASAAKIRVVGEDIEVPIKNLYKIKRQVGQDRLVNAYAAKELYGTPAVIIDLGTGVTFDIVSRKGEYLGGLIMPGIEMCLESLHDKTALLPKVKLAPAKHIIGRETKECMRAGILFGYGAMCDGLVSKYKKMLGNDIKVIATGGNASLIKRYSKSIQIVDENLTLKGMAKL